MVDLVTSYAISVWKKKEKKNNRFFFRRSLTLARSQMHSSSIVSIDAHCESRPIATSFEIKSNVFFARYFLLNENGSLNRFDCTFSTNWCKINIVLSICSSRTEIHLRVSGHPVAEQQRRRRRHNEWLLLDAQCQQLPSMKLVGNYQPNEWVTNFHTDNINGRARARGLAPNKII